MARLLWVLKHLPVFRSEPGPAGDPRPGKLIAVLPARNEALSVEASVRSLLAQEGVDLEVWVVNDHSTDETGAIADRMAEVDRRVHVLHNPELESGWLGKHNAMQQAAARTGGEFLLFSDADVVHGPGVLRDALEEMEREKADLLSLMPRIQSLSLLEHAQLPNFVGFMMFFVRPPRAGREGSAIAAGAFMLIRRHVFEAVGGFSRIRNRVLDDLELARMVRREGCRTRYYFAPERMQVRLFKGNRDAFWGGTKNILGVLENRSWSVLGALVMPVVVFGAPILAMGWGLIARDWAGLGLGLGAYLCHYSYLLFIRRFWSYCPGKALAFPLVALVDFCCGLRAFYYYSCKQSVLWRGRVVRVK